MAAPNGAPPNPAGPANPAPGIQAAPGAADDFARLAPGMVQNHRAVLQAMNALERLMRVALVALRVCLLILNCTIAVVGVVAGYFAVPGQYFTPLCVWLQVAGFTGNWCLIGRSRIAGLVVMVCVFFAIAAVHVIAPSVEYIGTGEMDATLAAAKVGSTGELELEPRDFQLISFFQVTFSDLNEMLTEGGCRLKTNMALACSTKSPESDFLLAFFSIADSFVKESGLEKDVDSCVAVMHKIIHTTDDNTTLYCHFRTTSIHMYPYSKFFFWIIFVGYVLSAMMTTMFSLQAEIVYLWKHNRADLWHYVIFIGSLIFILLAKVVVLGDTDREP
eukprot:GEMP01026232.1.p1 GENE.GEMP01026232.1~~GEMP01026232.1.p1  ORF type:complete len:332 (+),score=48.46 GEMP01026232.1:27-1022(+)